MMGIEREIRDRLLENVDEGYKAFHAKLEIGRAHV